MALAATKQGAPPPPNTVKKNYTVSGGVKTAVVVFIGGTMIYTIYLTLGPLIKIIKGVDTVVDTVVDDVGTAADAGVQEVKLILGLPESIWSIFAGTDAKFKPSPQWTPAYVAQHKGDISWLAVGEIITTWCYAVVTLNHGETAGTAFIDKWLSDQKADKAIAVLQDAIMYAYNWSSPYNHEDDGRPLSMKDAGSPFSLHDNGVPMHKLYRLTATMADAGPEPKAQVHVTSGYFVADLWDKMFPPPHTSTTTQTSTGSDGATITATTAFGSHTSAGGGGGGATRGNPPLKQL